MAYTYEDMQGPADFIGPWTYDVEMPDGEIRRFGYEAPSEVEYPERWDAEYDGFQESRRELDGLDRRIVAAYSRELAEARAERLRRIMLWIARAPKKVLKRNRRLFWLRILDSRKVCAETGLWYHVYLTKAQVDTVFAAFEWRMEGGVIEE